MDYRRDINIIYTDKYFGYKNEEDLLEYLNKFEDR